VRTATVSVVADVATVADGDCEGNGDRDGDADGRAALLVGLAVEVTERDDAAVRCVALPWLRVTT
jgi:hypothetical protein